MSVIKKFWAASHTAASPTGRRVYVNCPRIECADGFTMSVQASEGHYCSPRLYVEDGDYSAWEIGFPSEQEDLIMKWAEKPGEPTETVYGWVPTGVIDAVIEKHGDLSSALADRLASLKTEDV